MIRVIRCSCCGGPVKKLRPPKGRLNRPVDGFIVWRCLLCNVEVKLDSSHLCNIRTIGTCAVPAVSGNQHGR